MGLGVGENWVVRCDGVRNSAPLAPFLKIVISHGMTRAESTKSGGRCYVGGGIIK